MFILSSLLSIYAKVPHKLKKDYCLSYIFLVFLNTNLHVFSPGLFGGEGFVLSLIAPICLSFFCFEGKTN